MPFVEDPIAVALAAGDRPRVFGINANLLSPPPDALAKAYAPLRDALAAAFVLTGVHIYPAHALHVTAANLVPFTQARVPPESQPAVSAAWSAALTAAATLPGWPSAPFPLVARTLRLDACAVILLFDDPTNAVEHIRGCIKQVFDNNASLESAFRPLGGRAASCYRSPSIIHMTLLRFTRPMEDAKVEATIGAAFSSVREAWTPLLLKADSLALVREEVPYMHLDQEACTILRLPFA